MEGKREERGEMRERGKMLGEMEGKREEREKRE